MISSLTRTVTDDIMASGAVATLLLFSLVGLKEFVFKAEEDMTARIINIFIYPLLIVLSFLIYVVVKDYVEFLATW